MNFPQAAKTSIVASLQVQAWPRRAVATRGLLVAALLHATCCAAPSQSVDKNEPYARVCLGIVNSTTGEEQALKASSTPGKGNKIVAHIDASAKCEAVIVPFGRKTGQLMHGWRPQFAEVAAWNEVLFPKAPVSWDWIGEIEPVVFHVLIFARGSKDSAEIKKLVAATQNTKNEALAKSQVNKLRELIGRVELDNPSLKNVAKEEKAEVGGVFRMVVGFEWRDSARSVNFTPEKPGTLVLP